MDDATPAPAVTQTPNFPPHGVDVGGVTGAHGLDCPGCKAWAKRMNEFAARHGLATEARAMGGERVSKLIAEYRASMDREVLHSWAADLVTALTASGRGVPDGLREALVQRAEADRREQQGRYREGRPWKHLRYCADVIDDILKRHPVALAAAPTPPMQDIEAVTGCADDQGLFAQPDMDEGTDAC